MTEPSQSDHKGEWPDEVWVERPRAWPLRIHFDPDLPKPYSRPADSLTPGRAYVPRCQLDAVVEALRDARSAMLQASIGIAKGKANHEYVEMLEVECIKAWALITTEQPKEE